MKKKFTDLDRRVLAATQGGFPLSPTPYEDMAADIGVNAGDLLGILTAWRKRGILRRVGAVLNHFKAGSGAGAMVVWKVPEERVDRVGRLLAGFTQVSHAYHRREAPGWPYNVYTMVHGATQKEVSDTVRQMKEACGLTDCRVLFTQRELKKTAPVYIHKPQSTDH